MTYSRLGEERLLRSTQRREVHVFVERADLAVLDAHRDAYRHGDLCPGGRASGDRGVLWNGGAMEILDAMSSDAKKFFTSM